MTARAGSRARTAARWRCTRWPGSPSSRSCRRPTSSRCPKGLSLRARRCSACAVFTAYGAVKHAGAVSVGDRVAVVAAGGVGLNIVAMARAFGARQVIAVDVALDKLEAARALGASDVVDSSAVDAVAAVRELTAGEGVDIAFEALGRPATVAQAFRMVRDGGAVVCVGIGAGAAAAEIEITHLVRRGIRLIGSFGARTRADMPRVIELAASGAIDLAELISVRVNLEGPMRSTGRWSAARSAGGRWSCRDCTTFGAVIGPTQDGLDVTRPEEMTAAEIEAYAPVHRLGQGAARLLRVLARVPPRRAQAPQGAHAPLLERARALAPAGGAARGDPPVHDHGFREGVAYEVRLAQTNGALRSDILDTLSVPSSTRPPRHVRGGVYSDYLGGMRIRRPTRRASRSTGLDAAAFDSGMDYSTREASAEDMERLVDWYERTLGEVPRYVRLLVRERPGLLKAYRDRYEHAIRDSLPCRCCRG